MKLHIIGPGVVGIATGSGFARFGHDVIYTNKGDDHAAVTADLHFICTPESTVKEVAAQLCGVSSVASKVVVRSSVAPGTTQNLQNWYPNCRFYHNPEFLREAVANQDFLNADRAIIGVTYCDLMADHLSDLYHQMGIPVYKCFSDVSEMVKLVTNAYLATQVSFWNAVEDLCEKLKWLDINSHEIARLVALDHRVSHYGAYQHGAPYAGHCLPKDMEQLLQCALDYRAEETHLFLKAVQKVNQSLGGT